MSRISERFARLRREGRKAFIPYLTAGDPDLETTGRLLLALAEAGADLIELGVPFSDPMADGPVIQRASERALKHEIGVAEVLRVAERFRARSDVPVVLFTYFNPLLKFLDGSSDNGSNGGNGDNSGNGVKDRRDRAARLASAGIDGVLVTDLIPEEAEEFVSEMRAAGLETIFLVAPTSTEERIEKISRVSSGFIYVVARTGVTGMREALAAEVREIVARVKRASDLPVAVGFGISQPEHVREVWSYADAAVVGSRLVLEIEQHQGQPDLVERVEALARHLIGK